MFFSSIRKYWFPVFLFCSMLQNSSAQVADTTMYSRKQGYIASYWKNGIRLVTNPARWNGDDWARLGGSIAITAGFVSMDEPISQPFFDWQTDFGVHFGNAGEFMGSVPVQLSISGLAMGAGLVAHNKPLQNFALDNLQAQAFTGGITWIVKELAHRERPIEGNGAYKWHGPFKGGGNESFFSGHTSISFCTATMIYLHSHKKWWVGLISYSMATGVAVSRMQKQMHWASDVVAGAFMGTAIATFVYKQQEKRREYNHKVIIIP